MDRFCINCRHCVPSGPDGVDPMEFARCGHPEARRDDIDFVRGGVTTKQRYASIMRMCVHPCGPEGKLFEAKAPRPRGFPDLPKFDNGSTVKMIAAKVNDGGRL